MLTPGRYVGAEATVDDGEPVKQKIQRLTSLVSEGFKTREMLQNNVLKALNSIEANDA